jgi:hypothetical protein
VEVEDRRAAVPFIRIVSPHLHHFSGHTVVQQLRFEELNLPTVQTPLQILERGARVGVVDNLSSGKLDQRIHQSRANERCSPCHENT